MTTVIGLIFDTTWKIVPSDYNNYADSRDCVEKSFVNSYADYNDIQYYMKNNSISDYAKYADFEYQIQFHHWLRWL